MRQTTCLYYYRLWSMQSEGKVRAFVRGDTSLVWSAEGAVCLRVKQRVVGSLVGALPQQARQSGGGQQLGLPLELSAEETTLLLELGAIELRLYSDPCGEGGGGGGAEFQQLRAKDFETQFLEYVKARQSSQTCGSSKRPRLDATSADADKLRRSFSPLVCIHTADPRSDLCPLTFPQGAWSYPSCDHERWRYAVFRDLWRRGFHLTSAVKYGGDFLVYDGDPFLVHSRYIAVVLPWKQPIRSLVSYGRLGAKVKKTTLLCAVHEDSIEYVTLDWGGWS